MGGSTELTGRTHGHHHMERKLKKPLMEKRRRARINQCLIELKHLLLQASPHQRTKLEKADILEMTVNYLRNKQSTDQQIYRQNFVDGFNQCSNAVLQYTNVGGPFDANFRMGLMNHLSSCLVNNLKQQNFPSSSSIMQQKSDAKLQPPIGSVVRPQPCIPLTLSIPHQRCTGNSMSSQQMLPTPPLFMQIHEPNDSRDLSPSSQSSSSLTVAESASFSPCSHYSTTTPPSDHEDGRRSLRETSVWRPW